MSRIALSLFLIGFPGFLFSAPVFAQGTDLSPEEIVTTCEHKTGFKATDRAARGFIFRRCVQTIQTEKGNQIIAETKAIHRQNLQTRATPSFLHRGTGDRTLLQQLRIPRSRGVRRVYADPNQFRTIQFNRARSPTPPETPKEQQMQNAKVDAALDRYQMQQFSDICGNLSGIRKDICLRAQLQKTAPRRWTGQSRQ